MMDVNDLSAILLWSAGAVIGGLILVWLLAYGVGWLSRRVGLPGWASGLATLATPIALVLAVSVYLDQAGQVGAGQIVAKDERIGVSTTWTRGTPGWWWRHLWATVVFTTNDGPITTLLLVDEERFDGLRPGASVQLRYLPQAPFIARLADQSTLSLVPWPWLLRAGLIFGSLFVIWLLFQRRAPWSITGPAIAAAILVNLLQTYPPFWEAEPTGPLQTALAEVRATHSITIALLPQRGSSDASQPWEIVELTFVPQGLDQPVVAIDGVDAGSVPGLAVGARLPVRYSAETPRAARLVQAARSYRWREWQDLIETTLVAAIVIGGFLAFGRLASWTWRRLLTSTNRR